VASRLGKNAGGELDCSHAEAPRHIEILRSVVNEDCMVGLGGNIRKQAVKDRRVGLAGANVAADDKAADIRGEGEPIAEFSRPLGDIVGETPNGGHIRGRRAQKIEGSGCEAVAIQVIVLDRWIKTDRLPKVAG